MLVGSLPLPFLGAVKGSQDRKQPGGEAGGQLWGCYIEGPCGDTWLEPEEVSGGSGVLGPLLCSVTGRSYPVRPLGDASHGRQAADRTLVT